jgi:hypothetical protein
MPIDAYVTNRCLFSESYETERRKQSLLQILSQAVNIKTFKCGCVYYLHYALVEAYLPGDTGSTQPDGLSPNIYLAGTNLYL